jgi:hypothetical protein
MTTNTIKVKNYSNVIEELVANAAITPGMLIEQISTGKVRAHATIGGTALAMFALEDELQGKTIDDAYAADNRVQCWIPNPGDQVNALLDDGETVVIGDFLESAGNGYLQKYVADVTASDESDNLIDHQVIAVAVTAVDLSGSSDTYPTAGKRIVVRIV